MKVRATGWLVLKTQQTCVFSGYFEHQIQFCSYTTFCVEMYEFNAVWLFE